MHCYRYYLENKAQIVDKDGFCCCPNRKLQNSDYILHWGSISPICSVRVHTIADRQKGPFLGTRQRNTAQTIQYAHFAKCKDDA